MKAVPVILLMATALFSQTAHADEPIPPVPTGPGRLGEQAPEVPTGTDAAHPIWYQQAVFEGEILQAPWFISSDEMMLFTSDSVVQRFSFRKGTIWRYDFERIPWKTWYLQKEGGLYIPLLNQVLFFSPAGLVGRSAFFWSEPLREERFVLIDGRVLHIRPDGEVKLFSNLTTDTTALLHWRLPVNSWKELLVSPQGNIILQTENKILWYSLDGRPLAEAVTGSHWNKFVMRENEILLHSPSSGSYRRYLLGGKELSIGKTPGRGRFIAFITLQDSSPVYIHIDEGTVLLYGPDGSEYEILHLEEPWKYGHLALHDEYLYLSDSKWRLHRLDLQSLVKDFFNQQLQPQPYIPVEEESSVPGFLPELLVKLADTPDELHRQLNRMVSPEDGLRGRLLLYETALRTLLEHIYAAEDTYGVNEPAIRSLALKLFLQYGGNSAAQTAANFLKVEVSPFVFQEVLPHFAGKSISVQIALVNRINAFIRSADDWQRPEALIELYFEYLMRLYNGPATDNLHALILDALNLIYANLDDPVIRRRILGLNMPILQ